MGKVLIIDDEKQILGLLSRIIGLEGYEVLQAATCKAGLRRYCAMCSCRMVMVWIWCRT
jgi:DNA-binding NtrC family response regulator